MKEAIILFTTAFPYGNGEQWLESEILYLAKKFKQVYIYPESVDENPRPLPTNCQVISTKIKFKAEKKIRHYVLKHLFAILRHYTYLIRTSKNKKYYLKNILKVIIDLAVLQEESILFYSGFEKYLKETNILYFYWHRKPFINFALLKAQGKIKHKLVSRAHGYDYDPAQNHLRFFPYRELELKYIDNLVVNNNWGARLTKKLYPMFSKTISFCYVGVENQNKINPPNQAAEFHLVSCSGFIELKRVNLIIEILKHLSIPVKWTHFGTGPLFEEIKQQAGSLPDNIICDFAGFQSNSHLLNYYETVPCDLFITTTRREGLPNSVMESISRGIPVIGTSVCGIPEIVNKKTGFLIKKNFNAQEVAEIITDYAARSIEEKAALRRSAREFYETNFDSKTNYNFFINTYLSN